MLGEALVWNETSGYWGRHLFRRDVGNGIVQLHEADAPPEVVTPHGHTNAHIVFVTRGSYVTSVTGENSFVARPVAVFNPPDTWHRDHFVGGRGSFMTIDLEVEGLADGHVRHDLSARVLQFCNRLSHSLKGDPAIAIEDAVASLSKLFEFEKPHDFDGVPAGVERAYEAICDDAEPWSLTMGQLARIAGVHANHLPRAFRTRFGLTVSQIISRRQVELCGQEIANSPRPLADIAVDCGFYDQAHMTSRFRQIAGMTPARWRRKLRQG